MNELRVSHELGIPCKAFAQPVFHRLDVVIGTAFDEFDLFRVGLGKVCCHAVEFGNRSRRQRLNVDNMPILAQRFKPLYFQMDAIADQRKFAEIGPQGRHFGTVSSIEGREGGEEGRIHIWLWFDG